MRLLATTAAATTLFLLGCSLAKARIEPLVECSEDSIKVALDTSAIAFRVGDVYLENLKGFPMCQPTIKDNLVRFDINLKDEFRCGASRMTNQLTGRRTYFQRVILEHEDDSKENEVVLIQCQTGDQRNRTKRQTLPSWPDIVEPNDINITEYIEARAPIPNLDLGIKQNGRMLDTTHNVQPGTPLEMVVYLDPVSKSTYGILASFLKVSDSAEKQEEIIVMNGCSIDPYIFSNFVTPDNGDSLSATFKAFKFPDSNYVMFSGTVSICINQCKGVPCGNGQFGYGRRRRRRRRRETVPERDPNAIYSVDMTTMLKVRFSDDLVTLQKGAVSADFSNANLPAHVMNHIEGVDVSAEGYSAQSSADVRPACAWLAYIVAVVLGSIVR
ncbi:hypothetical protein BIW11_01623 [Tropilaelaps mercedesae]|uniref:ZP domain-containing protein n=1 Tax=Tropilaelaps mercedesae TaxID=418985 RepID=A0A1V9XB90_9ACAR|nr:hypothetical protein BIW11_01623 [Tropilaelaps mercedesae]